MLIQRIHHVAYRCRDARETVLWYQRHLGMGFVLAIAEDQVPSTHAPDPYMHVFLDAGGGNQCIGRFKRHTDETDLDALDLRDPVGRQRGLASDLVDDIGGKPLEVRARERSIGEVATVNRVTAAVLHAEQFGDALVKLVVTDA